MSETAMHRCECCGSRVRIASSEEGTAHYEPITDLAKLLVTWRYWDTMTQAATPDEYAEYHDQFLGYDRQLKDEADRLAAELAKEKGK